MLNFQTFIIDSNFMTDHSTKSTCKNKPSCLEDTNQMKCMPKRGTNQTPYQKIEFQLRKDAHFWPPITAAVNESGNQSGGADAAAKSAASSPQSSESPSQAITALINETAKSNGSIRETNEMDIEMKQRKIPHDIEMVEFSKL